MNTVGIVWKLPVMETSFAIGKYSSLPFYLYSFELYTIIIKEKFLKFIFRFFNQTLKILLAWKAARTTGFHVFFRSARDWNWNASKLDSIHVWVWKFGKVNKYYCNSLLAKICWMVNPGTKSFYYLLFVPIKLYNAWQKSVISKINSWINTS